MELLTYLEPFFEYDEEGNTYFKLRGPVKTIVDLARMLDKNPTEKAVDTTVALVQDYQRWEWWDKYISHCHDQALVMDYNIFKVGTYRGKDENGFDELWPLKDVPDDMYKARVFTKDIILSNVPEYRSYLKRKGAFINGVQIDLGKNNQDGLVAVDVGIRLALKFKQDMFPIKFRAETVNGTQVVQWDNVEEFELFALKFLMERQKYYK